MKPPPSGPWVLAIGMLCFLLVVIWFFFHVDHWFFVFFCSQVVCPAGTIHIHSLYHSRVCRFAKTSLLQDSSSLMLSLISPHCVVVVFLSLSFSVSLILFWFSPSCLARVKQPLSMFGEESSFSSHLDKLIATRGNSVFSRFVSNFFVILHVLFIMIHSIFAFDPFAPA